MARSVERLPVDAVDRDAVRYRLAYPAVTLAIPLVLYALWPLYGLVALGVVLCCSVAGFFHYTGSTHGDHVCFECGEGAAVDPEDHAVGDEFVLGPRGAYCGATAVGALLVLVAALNL